MTKQAQKKMEELSVRYVDSYQHRCISDNCCNSDMSTIVHFENGFLEGVKQERDRIMQAIRAQFEDDTLWAVNVPGEPFEVTVTEAHVIQSLRWLHKFIKDDDQQALKAIINQSKADI